MRDGGSADAAFRSDDCNDPADRLGFRGGKQSADRTHYIQRIDGGNDVVADAPAHQFAVKGDVIDTPDHDDAGSGVADGGELIEAGQNIVAAFGFEDNHIRRRRRAIGFDSRRHASHLNLQMSLAEPAVFAARLHGGRGFHGFAKRLHGYPRRRRNMVVRTRGWRCLELLFGILVRVAHHLPISLSLALSASG